MLDERIIALGACFALLALLRYLRWRRHAPMRDARAMLQTADELWRLATSIPPAHLTTPLRNSVATALERYAETLGAGPLHLHTPILRERSARVLALPKRNPLQVQTDPVGDRCREISDLLARANADDILTAEELASAQMAAKLSADMADIDALCGKAQSAAKYRVFEEAERYRNMALSTCENLPAPAAKRVRRVVDNRLGSS